MEPLRRLASKTTGGRIIAPMGNKVPASSGLVAQGHGPLTIHILYYFTSELMESV